MLSHQQHCTILPSAKYQCSKIYSCITLCFSCQWDAWAYATTLQRAKQTTQAEEIYIVTGRHFQCVLVLLPRIKVTDVVYAMLCCKRFWLCLGPWQGSIKCNFETRAQKPYPHSGTCKINCYLIPQTLPTLTTGVNLIRKTRDVVHIQTMQHSLHQQAVACAKRKRWESDIFCDKLVMTSASTVTQSRKPMQLDARYICTKAKQGSRSYSWCILQQYGVGLQSHKRSIRNPFVITKKVTECLSCCTF